MLKINKNNYKLIAARYYSSPIFLQSEFELDLKHLRYVQRAISRFGNSGKLNEKVTINRIILMCNVFGISLTVKLLFLFVEEKNYSTLATMLSFLSILPSTVTNISDRPLDTTIIQIDNKLMTILQEI